MTRETWKDELRVWAKGTLLVVALLPLTVVAAFLLDAGFGDVGKVLFGGLCFWVGYCFVPWVIEKRPGWFK